MQKHMMLIKFILLIVHLLLVEIEKKIVTLIKNYQTLKKVSKLLLMKSDAPISTVAESVGITDYNYFTKIFRSVTGVTPSHFRKLHRHNIEN